MPGFDSGVEPIREGSHYFGCPTGQAMDETLCTCPRKEKTDYRLLFADKELLDSAEEINDRLCEMEPDQSWSELDTCMVAFARMIDLGYAKPAVSSPDPLASIAESLGEITRVSGRFFDYLESIKTGKDAKDE